MSGIYSWHRYGRILIEKPCLLHYAKMTRHELPHKGFNISLLSTIDMHIKKLCSHLEWPNKGYADVKLNFASMHHAGCGHILSLCVSDLCYCYEWINLESYFLAKCVFVVQVSLVSVENFRILPTHKNQFQIFLPCLASLHRRIRVKHSSTRHLPADGSSSRSQSTNTTAA